MSTTAAALAAEHETCDALVDAASPACRLAAHRLCASDGCAAAGAGVLHVDDAVGMLGVSCLDPGVVE